MKEISTSDDRKYPENGLTCRKLLAASGSMAMTLGMRAAAQDESNASAKPNVVMIIADQVRSITGLPATGARENGAHCTPGGGQILDLVRATL